MKPFKIKSLLFSGLVVLVPFGLTVYVLDLVISTADLIIEILPETLRPPEWLHFPGFGVVVSFIVCLLIGIAVRNFLGNFILKKVNLVIERIPFVASVYSLFREISEVFLGGDKKKGFKGTVLVEWPRKDSWTIAFLTSDTKGSVGSILQDKRPGNYFNLFIPTTPNPTSGFYFIVHEDDVVRLDMSVDTAFKVIISGGTLTPEVAAEAANK